MENLREFIEKKKEKSASRKPRYGTRKLSVGLVSCVLGYCIFLSPTVVSAQVEEGSESTPTTIEASADTSGSDTDTAESSEPATNEEKQDSVEATSVESKDTEAVESSKVTEAAPAEVEETEAKEALAEAPVVEAEKEVPAEEVSEKEETREAEGLSEESEVKEEAPVLEVEGEKEEDKLPAAEEEKISLEEVAPEEELSEEVPAEENLTEEADLVEEENLELGEEVDPEALQAGETEEYAITNVEITIGGAENGENTEIVNPTALPNRIEEGNTDINLEARVDFDIPEGTKQGKTFDFVVSDNVNLHGVLESETEGQPVVFDGEEIATAEKLTDGRNGYKYTFNEKVDGLKDIRVRIIYPLFIDPDKVPMGTKEYEIGEDGQYVLDDEGNPVLKADNKETVSVTVGGKTANKDYTVEYENEVFDIKDNVPTLSGTADIDQVTDNNYNHTIYVNPTADQLLNGSHVTVQNEKGYNTVTFDEEVKNSVKVYKVKDPNKLPLSFGNNFDDENYEDVTDKAEVKLEKDANNADLNKLVVNVKQGNTDKSMPFDDKDFDSSSYVITYTGKRTPNKAFKTNTIFTADWRKANGNVKNLSHIDNESWAWTNEIVIDDADAIAIANKTYSLGDKVWIDADEDGSQGDSEEGLEGVKVILKGINMSDKETTTDANGNYKFEGLRNGEYTVEFENPEGYKPTTAKAEDVTEENNSDAIQAEGAKVATATGTIQGKDNMNVDFGVIESEAPTPEEKTYSLGDKVWIDEDKDGIQGEKETGKSGVTVKLTGGDLTEEKTTTTDENGNYKFEGLKNGDYKVEFVIPEGYKATKSDQGGDDTKDSDGTSVNVTIKDANNDTIDLGLIKKEAPTPEEKTYSLGDKVWIDEDKDGIQGGKETGKSGVTVKLTGGDLTEEKTTTTDENGNYKFEGLKNGEYKVTFEVPEGYEITKTDEGTDDEKDSDGKEVTVTIKDEDNMSVDLGLVKQEAPVTPSEPTEPEEPKDTTPLVPLTPAEEVEVERITHHDHKTPGTPVMTEVPSTPVVETEKSVEEKTEKIEETKEVENKEEKVEKVKEAEGVKTLESEDEVVEDVETREDDENLAPVTTNDDTKAPKTGDAGILSSLGLGSLAASGLAFIELKKRNKKNK